MLQYKRSSRSTECKTLVLDGKENIERRCFLTISALYHCANELASLKIKFIDVDDPSVSAAIDVLRYDTGLRVHETEYDHSTFEDVCLYAGVVLREPSGLRTTEAAMALVPTLIAAQFPPVGTADSSSLALVRSAHDPSAFARALVAKLAR